MNTTACDLTAFEGFDSTDDVEGFFTADYGYALVLDPADNRQNVLVAPGFGFPAQPLGAASPYLAYLLARSITPGLGF
jgi:hypothetical protein